MFYVYLLKSKKDDSLHVGLAPNLKTELLKYNIKSSKNLKSPKLVYYEAYKSKKDALIREKRLKQFKKGYASLKGRIVNSITL